MTADRGLWQHLSLLRTSPDFVLIERPDGQFTVTNPNEITPEMGVVWLSAQTDLANGQTCESVVVLDTANGGPERALYLWLNEMWFDPANPNDRADLLKRMAWTEADLFPYRWTSHVRLRRAGSAPSVRKT